MKAITDFFINSQTTALPLEVSACIRDVDDPTVAAMAALLMALSGLLVTVVDKVVGLDRFLELR